MFPQPLAGVEIKWFNKLPAQSIGTYHELVGEFCSHYKYNRRDRKGCNDLFLINRRTSTIKPSSKDESIRQFTRCFKQELTDVDGANDQTVIEAYKQAYQYDQRGIYGSLVRIPPKTLKGLYDRVEEYARVEDDSKSRETRYVHRSSNHPNDGRKDKSKNRSNAQHNDRGEVREKNQSERMQAGYQKYHDMKLTPLNIQLAELYEKIIKDLSPPRPLPAETRDKRDKSKYCKFHKDHGHKTENCRALQIEVQRMIDAGKLQEYVKKDFGKGPGQFGTTHVTNAHVINVSHARIHSMTRRSSEDETRRKLRHLKEWYLTNHIDFVSGNGAEIQKIGFTKIYFYAADMIGVYGPHNDVTVITAWIGMFRVHRILVDTGSSVSVLFSGAYSSMNLPHDLIEEDENPIIGFSGEVTKAIGKVKIPITVDDKYVLGNFLLLDCRAPYNAIVGRDWIHEIGAVTSSYHQCLKFLTPEGVVKVRSDQMAAHKCHESAIEEYKKSEVTGNETMRVEQK
ncbi:uncharacterized protein LOC113316340 [Papaver somniferum]|uniref:uncharacterized protein LOC113316340 n=1 Tax=Papaver somniferum TaxID=3469 RepID=UPI000E6FBAE7|nr:uncharacterized protein LOC113316340 [Papaver somniferum]